MSSTKPLLILIDGHSLAFRSYYAFSTSKQGALRTTTGIPTSICFGFLNSVLQVLENQQPQYLAIAFDRSEPTFRHEADVNYKANRKETPEDFIPDIQNLQKLLTALNLQIVTAPGYEADDVIATLATKASQTGYQVKILSGDRDLFQLVDQDKNISVLYLDNRAIKNSGKTTYTEFDPIAVEQKMGIKPIQVVDYKALCGDQSDNIPGIRGIGDKTAIKLLTEYQDLDNIYQNLEKIKGTLKTKLQQGKPDAEHSRYLAKLILDTPLAVELDNCKLQGFNTELIIPLLKQLELNKFVKQINHLQQQFGGTVTPETEIESIINDNPESTHQTQQLSLFDTNQPSVSTTSVNPVVAHYSLETSIVKPLIIDSVEQLEQLIKLLATHTNPEIPVAWDTETSGLDPLEADLVGIGCCWGKQPDEVAYIPIGHHNGQQLNQEQVITALRPILESNKYPKAFQNTKFDRIVFWTQGINLAGVVFDTMLASYIIHSETTHNLTDLSIRYLSGIIAKSYKDLGIPKGKTIADLDITTTAIYCGLDAYATFALVEKLQAELKKIPELSKLLVEVEQPLEPVLAKMERQGVKIDIAYLQKLSKQVDKDLQDLEKKAYEEAGESFNLGSPKQLSDILFDKLNLSRKKSRKIKTGYSTDHATLEKLQGEHPIIDYILEHRTLSKLKSTYIDALPTLVKPKTHRVHTDFNQAATSTGRLSSSNPNLQNIPIRTEFSRQIRKAFIPESGWLLVAADYSQIELRILAHLSQEPLLVKAYQEGDDVHSVTARMLLEKDDITSEERRLGKIINFGVIYGMGAQRFARESGIASAIGKEFIDKYHQRYAHIFNYLETVKKQAITQGFVTTILDRRRYFEFTSDRLRNLRGTDPQAIDLDKLEYNYNDHQLLRAAANASIQGSSADIIKVAMIKLDQILQNYQARLLLQVHDELVLEIPPDEWEELQTIIPEIMINAIPLSVPLEVEIHAGNNWMEAK